MRPQREPFHLLHFLAIQSCRGAAAPDEIVLHVAELPYGVYWEMARELVTLDRIGMCVGLPIEAGPWASYSYAHAADVARLDILAADGGLYADIDTLFLRPIPDALWAAPAVIGREADVKYGDAPLPEPSMSNALLMAAPGSDFVVEWRRRIFAAMDGTWSGHSCRLATRLAVANPDWVHVEPQSTFHPFDHNPAGIAAMLEEPLVPGSLDRTVSMHLCAHLWWEEHRRDFSRLCAFDITEARLASDETALAYAARPYLPVTALW
jgi:hypothetical protein